MGSTVRTSATRRPTAEAAGAERLAARIDTMSDVLQRAAEDMLPFGVLGAAAMIDLPGAERPVVIAAGSVDRAGGRELSGAELHPIGSQSRMFAAACVLSLAREGHFMLDDRISKYIPDIPTVDDHATIDHFINHTSGIGDFAASYDLLPFPMPTFSFDELMSLTKLQGRRFVAGSKYEYSNTDIVVLARLCEVVTGEPFENVLSARVLEPLGMTDTMVAAGQVLPSDRMAHGYFLPEGAAEDDLVDTASLADFSVAAAAGNIISSLPDMLTWSRAMLSPGNAIGLSHEDFTTNPVDAHTDFPHWYTQHVSARGVEGHTWGGRTFWGHRGGFYGYLSGTLFEPESGVAVSAFLTMVTRRGIVNLPNEPQTHTFQTFLQLCARAAVDMVELP
ncbi:serine hydrolase domain-containing protein [Microbacterium sp. NPDC058342]|uniref:serine hydrolase domain-containing protein n=1 Tax=Microbacterium sp. NPDC058342 TaxID=3346454 RepID=UPI00366179A3